MQISSHQTATVEELMILFWNSDALGFNSSLLMISTNDLRPFLRLVHFNPDLNRLIILKRFENNAQHIKIIL